LCFLFDGGYEHAGKSSIWKIYRQGRTNSIMSKSILSKSILPDAEPNTYLLFFKQNTILTIKSRLCAGLTV
jgi:hypothetical protein